MPSLQVRNEIASQLGMRKKQIYKWYWEVQNKQASENQDVGPFKEGEALKLLEVEQLTPEHKLSLYMHRLCTKPATNSPRSLHSGQPEIDEKLVDCLCKHYKL